VAQPEDFDFFLVLWWFELDSPESADLRAPKYPAIAKSSQRFRYSGRVRQSFGVPGECVHLVDRNIVQKNLGLLLSRGHEADIVE